MKRCAVIGIGQTKHTTKRDDVSIAGMVREAAWPATYSWTTGSGPAPSRLNRYPTTSVPSTRPRVTSPR